MQITNDDKYLISVINYLSIRVWNLQKNKKVAVLVGHSDSITSIAVTSDVNHIVSGSADNSLRIWNIKDKVLKFILPGHTGKISSIVISNDQQYIVSGSCDCTVRLWNLKHKTQEAVFGSQGEKVICVTITPDNKYILSGLNDKVRVFNLQNKKKIQQASLQVSISIGSIAVTKSIKCIAFGVDNNTVEIWKFKPILEVLF